MKQELPHFIRKPLRPFLLAVLLWAAGVWPAFSQTIVTYDWTYHVTQSGSASPTRAAVDGAGNVYVTISDSSETAIFKVIPGGMAVVAGGVRPIAGLAVDSAATSMCRIQGITRSGRCHGLGRTG